MTSLPDINVWLALTFQSHVHHALAEDWFYHEREQSVFCRTTQQGFLRLATNPRAFGDETLSIGEALEVYDRLFAFPGIAFHSEPTTVESLWREFSEEESFSSKLWTDAYLAAFACAENFELVTFDRDYKRFTGLNCTILS